MTSTTGKLVDGSARMFKSAVVALAAAGTLGTANVANTAAAREIAEFHIDNLHVGRACGPMMRAVVDKLGFAGIFLR
jgi:hypothetical protein